MRALEVVVRIVEDPAVKAQEMTDLMHVGFAFAALVLVLAIGMVVYHHCMGDEERESFGLGKKGQGRR